MKKIPPAYPFRLKYRRGTNLRWASEVRRVHSQHSALSCYAVLKFFDACTERRSYHVAKEEMITFSGFAQNTHTGTWMWLPASGERDPPYSSQLRPGEETGNPLTSGVVRNIHAPANTYIGLFSLHMPHSKQNSKPRESHVSSDFGFHWQEIVYLAWKQRQNI